MAKHLAHAYTQELDKTIGRCGGTGAETEMRVQSASKRMVGGRQKKRKKRREEKKRKSS